ncbi:hypothetical protein [Sedimenticola selenatireducens]|uniref:hypothetical protein n=1 Tax=Sedimenticola selenatireducens TaxID=191960 RepID=UPI002AAB3A19|nr:hypothetical protein [Sedimenticola selenatireducens]
MISYVNLSLPESERAFDLVGMQLDLEGCKELCEEYLVPFDGFEENGSEVKKINKECHATTILVKYGRCFKGGVRSKVQKELLATITEPDLSIHNLAIDIRDKHIAHSVNDLEEHRVRVYLHTHERERSLGSVNLESFRLTAPEIEFFRKLVGLIDTHLNWVGKQKYEELQLLQKIVEARYTVDELYEMSVAKHPNMGLDNVRKSRKAH